MDRTTLITKVTEAFDLGVADATSKKERAHSEQPAEQAAYDTSYNWVNEVNDTGATVLRPAVIQAAGEGWDDALQGKDKMRIDLRTGAYLPMQNTPLALMASPSLFGDIGRVYSGSYDLQKSSVTKNKYLLWGGIAVGALALLGIGYLAGKPSQNPTRGRKLLGSGKPARKFQIGDIVEVDGDPPFQGRVDYIFDYDQELGDYRYKLRMEQGHRLTFNEKSLRLIRKASRNPASGFTVKLDNMDSSDEDPQVTANVSGPGAAKWAKDDQTIDGTRWESDGDDFAYAVLSDDPGLVGRLEAEGYDLNLDEYSPPDEREEEDPEEEEEERGRTRYTSLGSYPIFYISSKNEVHCYKCATKSDKAEVNYEDPDLYCDECEERIESAYAEPEDEADKKENPARGSSTRDYDETTSIIEGMVTDAKFTNHVPQGMWGEVKQVMTALVGNGMDGVAEKFAAGMRKGNLGEVFVDDRVISGMKKVSSGYASDVTSAQFVKAFRKLRAAVR